MIGTPILNTYISAFINAEKESRHSDILFLPGGLNAPPLLNSFSNPLRTKKRVISLITITNVQPNSFNIVGADALLFPQFPKYPTCNPS